MGVISNTAKEITMQTICIDNKEYQVPGGVVRAIGKLEDELKREQKARDEMAEKYADLLNKDIDQVAWRVMVNLADGVLPSRPSKYGREKFEKHASVLVHDINFYEKTDTAGNPVFEYRAEVLSRVRSALQGRTNKGSQFKK